MHRPEEVRPLGDFRLHIRYADGVEGVVDLSDLAGRGVFEIWAEEGAFERVYIGPGGAIAWTDGVEICSDALYMHLRLHESVEHESVENHAVAQAWREEASRRAEAMQSGRHAGISAEETLVTLRNLLS